MDFCSEKKQIIFSIHLKILFDKRTVNKTRSIIQVEFEGIIENASRLEKPSAKFVDLDFKLNGLHPYTHLYIEQSVESESLN